MEDLPSAFERYARGILERYPEIQIKWEFLKNSAKRLTIFKQNENGFDVVVEAETYGLYPYAGEWHGPAWERVSGEETYEKLLEQFTGFVRSLLCDDSQLEVRYSDSRPYKWILTYPTEDGHESKETGLFFYNYFGRRSKRVFKNSHLPPRYK